MTNKILVFIRSKYLRDAQAYIGSKLPTTIDASEEDDDAIYMASELDSNWRDTEPIGMVMAYAIRPDETIEKAVEHAKNNIKRLYPDADEKIFGFIPAAVDEDIIEQLQ